MPLFQGVYQTVTFARRSKLLRIRIVPLGIHKQMHPDHKMKPDASDHKSLFLIA